MISVQVSCNLLAGCEFNTQFAEGVSSSQALQELNGKYGQGRIGFQAGDCKLDPPLLASPYKYDITWYGRNGRRNSFSVGRELTTPCPAELRDIVVATLIFEGKVLADPRTRILRSGS
jgi:hypothetical protein